MGYFDQKEGWTTGIAMSSQAGWLVDCEELFDRRTATERYGIEPEPLGAYYDDDRGLFLTVSSGSNTFIQDLIQFAPDAVAFTGSSCPIPLPSLQYQRQATGADEWIHFSIRLTGNGVEQVAGAAISCISQPASALLPDSPPSWIERTSNLNDPWKVVCLWLKHRRRADTCGNPVATAD
ncbi:hypothetical protein HED50_20565 [Ochrobactrum oryzae]|nr:hypothetical protein [Brucella oryzae]